MAAERLDGRTISAGLRDEAAARLSALAERGVAARVAVVRVGDDAASVSYAQSLRKSFEARQVTVDEEQLPTDSPVEVVAELLDRLSADHTISGIMLQEPVPAHLDAGELALRIDPAKDLDGVHPVNAGKLFCGHTDGLAPATARGGLELLRRSGIPLAGRRAVVIGRSTIVGRPFAMMLLHEHATVTVCHSRTSDLPAVCREAEILAAAVGRPGFVTPEMVRPGAVVVDFGINFVAGELCGDVAPEVAEVAGWLTPVPGGTGSMTTAALLANLADALERRIDG